MPIPQPSPPIFPMVRNSRSASAGRGRGVAHGHLRVTGAWMGAPALITLRRHSRCRRQPLMTDEALKAEGAADITATARRPVLRPRPSPWTRLAGCQAYLARLPPVTRADVQDDNPDDAWRVTSSRPGVFPTWRDDQVDDSLTRSATGSGSGRGSWRPPGYTDSAQTQHKTLHRGVGVRTFSTSSRARGARRRGRGPVILKRTASLVRDLATGSARRPRRLMLDRGTVTRQGAACRS